MDSPATGTPGSAPRRHLKRLSLSVSARDSNTAGYAAGINSIGSPLTPDKPQYATAMSPPVRGVAPSSAGNVDRDGLSPLNRSLGSSRRQRPMSMYAGSPLSSAGAPSSASSGTAASPASALRTSQSGGTPDQSSQESASGAPSHPLDASTSTPVHDSTLSPGSVASPSASRGSAGRRTILGRSGGSRRQSSISYARSPSSDAFASPYTPRSSLTVIRDEEEDVQSAAAGDAAHTSPLGSVAVATTPSRLSGDRLSSDLGSRDIESEAMQAQLSSSSSVNELNVGPGARSSELLTFIAKKERKCMDLREELKRQESELAALKKKWEAVIQRELAASTSVASPASSSMSPSGSNQAASSGLFSSLTGSLSASTSSQGSNSSAAGFGSPSPKPAASNRRLLTSRHSISVSAPSAAADGQSPYFNGGADLSPQSSPLDGVSTGEKGYDVQKMAKSWFGGVMKSASTVLEGLAPPPAQNPNDLSTVTEEEEPEEDTMHQHRRTRAGHPALHDRNGSAATTGTTMSSESSSPSSSCEDERFSNNASRSSSVSSLHSNSTEDEKDITPVATPVLPPRTPRGRADEERDLWALSGDFEDEAEREKRENMERNRIDLAKGSPRATAPSPRAHSSANKANHGRRRSTAFELGGAWGAMMGKKWNEMATTLQSSETFKASSKRAMGLVEGFERSLSEAVTPDNPNGEQQNTQLTLVNGEYIPTGGWSPPVASPKASDNANSLPSGIGGASAWSSLLGSRHKSNNIKSSEQIWSQTQTQDIAEHPLSPSQSNGSGRSLPKSLLDDDEPLHSPSAQPMTAQERIQASRTKHAKRMSLPANAVVPARSPTGLGLENVNEKDEDENAWGW